MRKSVKMGDGSISKNAILNVIRTAMTTMFPVITYMYVSRIFGKTGMGQLSFAKSIVTYFQLFAMLGVANYGTSTIGANKADKSIVCKNLREILFINIISMMVAYVFFIFCMLFWEKLLSYRFLLMIYSLQVFLQVIGIEWLYAGLEDFQYITLRTAVIQIISLISMLIFVHKKEDLYKYAIIQVIASAGANFFNFWNARKYLVRQKFGELELKKHLSPIIIIFFLTLFANLFTQLDTSMLGFIHGDDSVGVYSASDKLSSMISGLIGAISMVMLPRIAFYRKTNNVKEITRLLKDLVNIIFMIALPISIGVFVFAKQIILWFSGADFIDAVGTTQILSLRILLSPINALFVLHYFIPMGKEIRSLLVTGMAAVLNFIMNFYLIPSLSYNGASIATITAEILECVVIILFLKKDGYCVKELIGQFYQYIIASLPIILCNTLISSITSNSIICVVLTVIFSILGYIVILKYFENYYIIILLRKIRKIIKNYKKL